MQDFRMETFLAVCKFMNFTKAAEYLNLTQPAVSQHIRFLSQSYGVELFIMEGKRLQLTEAGKILWQAALNMKHDEQHMRERMLQTQVGLTSYAFGATLSVAEFMLAEDLRLFLRTHPQSYVRMQVGNTQELLQLLGASELDFAIVEGAFPKNEYAFLPYKKEDFVAVASPAKAKQYDGASIDDLLGETVFLREPGSGTREVFDQATQAAGFTVQPLWEGMSTSALVNAVVLGLGVAVLPRRMVALALRRGKIRSFEVEGMSFKRMFQMVWHKDKYVSPAMEQFLELCRCYELDYPAPKFDELA